MRRPDSTDRAQARDRAARHKRCVCGDKQPCTCTPSPGWLPRHWWPITWACWPLIVAAVQGLIAPKLDQILKEVKKMAEQTQAAVAELVKDLHRLADGYAALQASNAAKDTEIAELRGALATADADKEAAIAAAVSADDASDAAAIADADAIVEGLSPEPAPADGGDVPPADDGSGVVA